MKINSCYYYVMNGGIGYFLNLFFVLFWVICFLFILPAVYSLFCSGVLDCSLAIHQGTAFHYLVQSAETEKGFWGGMAHSSSTNSLFSSTEMFLVFFTLYPGSAVITGISEIIYAAQFSNDPVVKPGFTALCDFPWVSCKKQKRFPHHQ